MKTKTGLFFLCTILSLGAAAGAKAPAPATVHYEVRLHSSAFGDSGVRNMWIKGNDMRWEGKSQRLPICIVKNADGAFLIHPWNKIAAKYPKDSRRGNPKAIFPGPTGSIKTFLKSVKAEKCGAETIMDQKITIYGFVDPVSRRSCRIWVNDKSEKPVKLVMQGKRGKMDTITATYTKYVVGGKVPDALFDIPKGYAIRPMPTERLTSEAKTNKPKKVSS
ncbi:MAG: hypothetical protein ACYC64_07695 [Armatimonadota bacterium]